MARILRHPDLKSKGITFGNDYLLDLERRGKFPRRIKIAGTRFVGWLEEEVDRHIEAMAAERERAA
jgi:prophage regulatory protein